MNCYYYQKVNYHLRNIEEENVLLSNQIKIVIVIERKGKRRNIERTNLGGNIIWRTIL